MTESSIYIRPFGPDDYILINKWRNDHSLQMFTTGQKKYVSIEMEKEWVRDKMMNNSKEIYWAICLNDNSKRMIGYMSINNIDHLNKKLQLGGIVIGETDCRDGISLLESELFKLKYSFEELNMNRVDTKCLVNHPTAPIMLQSLGFRKEGTLRSYVFKNDHYIDVDIYSLLRDEYEELKKLGVYKIYKLIRRFRQFLKERSL